GVSTVCGWVAVGVSAAANGTLLPSVSPNALVAKRATATRRVGLRVSFHHRGLSFVAELWSSLIGGTSLLKGKSRWIEPCINEGARLLGPRYRGSPITLRFRWH